MSGTIEITHNNINTKLTALENIIKILHEININIDNKLINILNNTREEYEMGSINILSDYFLVLDHLKENTSDNKLKLENLKKNYFIKYNTFIRKENIIHKLDKIFNDIKKYVYNNIDKKTLHKIIININLYNNSSFNKLVNEILYEKCSCSMKMDIDPISSSLICKNCGHERSLFGTIFEDDQFYFQEGKRTKHGTYEPSKHCKFWVERIQARELTDIPESLIKNIKECIKQDKININIITCDQIRYYLRQLKNTIYNEHVALIRKLITGISPPQMTDHEIQLIYIYFNKITHIFDEIKSPKKTNCPYHPYFIYKIIEQIIPDTDKERKLKILSCIHLQSRETLICNDSIWKPICEKIKEFKYIPTDKNNYDIEF